MYRSESTSSSFSSVNGKSRGELKQVLKENGAALRRHVRTKDGKVTKATEKVSSLSPEALYFFRDELEKRAFINPVRVNQAAQGMLPGRPLLTRFAKSKAGKAYTNAAVKYGPALQDAAMAAGGAAQTYPEPMFMLNSGLGRAARHGLVGAGVPEVAADLFTFAKQNDPGIVSMAVRKAAPMLSPVADVLA
jgi:hypothetical protein